MHLVPGKDVLALQPRWGLFFAYQDSRGHLGLVLTLQEQHTCMRVHES